MTRENWNKSEIAAARTKAQKGDQEAQALLGALYASGSTGRINTRAAFAWYKRASDSGLPDAQYNLGIMYLRGEGTRKNKPLGLALLRAAASQDYDNAQELLGQIYELGAYSVRKNRRAAERWYLAAAQHGNSRAKFSLGVLLALKKNSQLQRRGIRFIRQAAAAGVRDAIKFLNDSGQ